MSIAINSHPYHDTSSSSSSFSTSSNCSSPESLQQEYILLNKKSSRIQCDFISDDKNDPFYWSQRSKNNLSAKRSRVKRRMNDLVLETKLTQLNNENQILRAKIDMLARKFGYGNGEEEQLQHNQLKPTVLNNSDQPSTQTNHSDTDRSLITTEQLPLDKPSMPIKWRLKLSNMTPDS
jgi:hypothetical protein